MTVLRPSLPPVICTTTRMVSRAPGLSAVGGWAAVLLKKPGTHGPRATRLDVFRKSRRFMGFSCQDMPISNRHPQLVQLKFGQRQHQMAQRADALIGGVLSGPINGYRVIMG